MSEIYVTGINKVINTAKEFLNELKEFAPFGLIFKDGEWIDLATYDETFDSIKMRNFLVATIIKDFEKNYTEFGAVCVDAKINDIGNVIMILNTSDGKDWYELVYRYEFIDGKVNIVKENIEY
ncbi:hypothetical protein LF887_17155 [Chryseobacterium sp. MEBOG06]|uniref:hypothetical protein n=1 Tax=Chryseobacterium sp. MEBOG06 TaxID=2879938 RepID=UPI001F3DB746|nr:hypothetical protein [Chryseobacterium sp. MEBOG06]UKB82732.1 hypothetical protein LF887_17155 [Chryseobacterium sp. MEBOG06]